MCGDDDGERRGASAVEVDEARLWRARENAVATARFDQRLSLALSECLSENIRAAFVFVEICDAIGKQFV